MTQNEKLRAALLLILTQIDYTQGNCRVNERIGALVPEGVLQIARDALEAK